MGWGLDCYADPTERVVQLEHGSPPFFWNELGEYDENVVVALGQGVTARARAEEDDPAYTRPEGVDDALPKTVDHRPVVPVGAFGHALEAPSRPVVVVSGAVFHEGHLI
jgi:hypothetical protein